MASFDLNSKNNHRHTEVSHILLRTVLFALVIVVFYGALTLFLRDNLHQMGGWLGEHLGLWGVGIYCFIVDMLIVPTTVDIVFPLTMDWHPVPLLITMSLTSMIGGFCGYLIARNLNRLRFVHQLTWSYHERGKALINRYGGWAVAIAGFTPVPFSTICWIAGLLEVPWPEVLIACTSRIPRMIIYYLLIRGGEGIVGLIPGWI